MRNKNTVYTVTPPDLQLNVIGPSILLLGETLETSVPYGELFDKLFPEVEISVYVSDQGFNPDLAAWYRAAAGMVSSIFVNLDDITAEEVFLAMQAEHENRSMVFWLSNEKKYPAMVALLNSYQYQVFESLDEVEKILYQEYSKNS